MENSGWRVGAKVVAYVDLVLLTLSVIVELAFTIVITVESGAAAGLQKELPNALSNSTEIGTGLALLWTITAIMALCTAIQLWAAIKLLSSTEIGRGINEALDKARFWRNVTIIFLVIEGLGYIVWCIIGSVWIAIMLVIYVIWRGGAIFIVYKFTRELEGAVVTLPFSVATKQ